MKTKLFPVCLMLCCIALCAPSAKAQTPDDDRFWTTVGSDGTVDETDARKVFFDHATVQMGTTLGGTKGSAKAPSTVVTQAESAVVRYNVTSVDGLFARRTPGCQPGTGRSCSGGVGLAVRYLSSGPSARVVAKLIEVDVATGVETVLLTFSSTAFPAASGYRVQEVSDCGPRWRFDFKSKAYYIEATLTHSSIAVSAAGIQVIRIENVFCPG
jgi:hypothetical protein